MGGMNGFKRLTPVEEALRLIHAAGIPALGRETVVTGASLGRVLERGLVSSVDVPPFDRTAVDGYAIRSLESFSASRKNPAIFRLRGIIEAGERQGAGERSLGAGEAYEVYTGAPLPRGADAVVMAEDAERAGDVVEVYRPAAKMANVSLRGEDIKAGELLLSKGTVLKPWHIGALASVGIGSVSVRRRARVGIFSTGSELVDLEAGRAAGGIIDSTRPMLIACLEGLGCSVLDGGIAEDRVEAIAGQIKRMRRGSDAVISIGGTSVGRKDLVPDALGETGMGRLIFHGLAIKPGKPTGYGVAGGKPLFLLPGYPVSALVGFEAVVEPVLCGMMGRGLPERPRVKARISRRVPTTPGIRHYLRVALRAEKGGLLAVPMTITGSGLLSSVTRADGIVVIREDLEGLEEGDEVEVGLLGRDGLA